MTEPNDLNQPPENPIPPSPAVTVPDPVFGPVVPQSRNTESSFAIGNVIGASVVGISGTALASGLLCYGKLSQTPYCLFLTLLTVLCVYILSPERWFSNRFGNLPTDPALVPRTIAFTMMWLFGVALILAGAVAAYKSTEGRDWVDAFKSGFLLLGGGVTTIVGYYFGSRQTTQAVEAARQSQTDANLGSQANASVQSETSAAGVRAPGSPNP